MEHNATHQWRTAWVSVPRILTLLVAITVAPIASADMSWVIQVTNNSGKDVNDIHLTFGFSGGLKNRKVLKPGNGIVTTVGTVPDFDAKFDPLGPGGIFEGSFDTVTGPIIVAGGYWTFDGKKVDDITGRDIKLQSVPEPVSIVAFGCGVAAMIRRRRILR